MDTRLSVRPGTKLVERLIHTQVIVHQYQITNHLLATHVCRYAVRSRPFVISQLDADFRVPFFFLGSVQRRAFCHSQIRFKDSGGNAEFLFYKALHHRHARRTAHKQHVVNLRITGHLHCHVYDLVGHAHQFRCQILKFLTGDFSVMHALVIIAQGCLLLGRQYLFCVLGPNHKRSISSHVVCLQVIAGHIKIFLLQHIIRQFLIPIHPS